MLEKAVDKVMSIDGISTKLFRVELERYPDEPYVRLAFRIDNKVTMYIMLDLDTPLNNLLDVILDELNHIVKEYKHTL